MSCVFQYEIVHMAHS